MNSGVLVEHIILNQLGSKPNQDGISMGFGTQNSIVRYITGQTNDDFIPILNYDNNLVENSNILVNGTRETNNIYYRDIKATARVSVGSLGAQLIRLYDNQNYGIRDIEWQNCFGYQNNNEVINYGRWGSLIIFSDYNIVRRTEAGISGNYLFKNLRGSSTRNVRFYSGNYSDIIVNDLIVDDKIGTTTTNISITGGIISNVNINSILYYAPTTIFEDTGGTLTNFVHTEDIMYET
jgi:hypothetical protein